MNADLIKTFLNGIASIAHTVEVGSVDLGQMMAVFYVNKTRHRIDLVEWEGDIYWKVNITQPAKYMHLLGSDTALGAVMDLINDESAKAA